jgi:hypothetical protein
LEEKRLLLLDSKNILKEYWLYIKIVKTNPSYSYVLYYYNLLLSLLDFINTMKFYILS